MNELYYLVAFVLGYLANRMMGNGLSVGGKCTGVWEDSLFNKTAKRLKEPGYYDSTDSVVMDARATTMTYNKKLKPFKKHGCCRNFGGGEHGYNLDKPYPEWHCYYKEH